MISAPRALLPRVQPVRTFNVAVNARNAEEAMEQALLVLKLTHQDVKLMEAVES